MADSDAKRVGEAIADLVDSVRERGLEFVDEIKKPYGSDVSPANNPLYQITEWAEDMINPQIEDLRVSVLGAGAQHHGYQLKDFGIPEETTEELPYGGRVQEFEFVATGSLRKDPERFMAYCESLGCDAERDVGTITDTVTVRVPVE